MSTKKDIIHLQKGEKGKKERETKGRKRKKVTLQYSHIIHYFYMCLPFFKKIGTEQNKRKPCNLSVSLDLMS